MRHPRLDFAVPPRFVALLDWVLDGYDPASGEAPHHHSLRRTAGVLDDVDSFLVAARAGQALDGPDQQELYYDNHPLEVIPFAHNGGDGLRYAWALLAPELELDELPCVSFAPVDPDGAVWLGDDTTQALETMLVGQVRGWDAWHERMEKDGFVTPRPNETDRWRSLCATLGLAPDLARTDVTPGARTQRRLVPQVPAGWRFEPADDGIGVLAPESAFAPGPFDRRLMDGEESTLRIAREHLAAGHPATSLLALKQGYFEDTPRPLVEGQRAAFLALGRPLLAARATRWLELHVE